MNKGKEEENSEGRKEGSSQMKKKTMKDVLKGDRKLSVCG